MPPTNASQRVHAVILASGTGSRLGAPLPKQFHEIAGETVLERAVRPFRQHPAVDHVRVVIPGAHRDLAERTLAQWLAETDSSGRPIAELVEGGDTRSASSRAGIRTLDPDDWVLVHDAARPFLAPAVIDRCLEALASASAVTVAIPSSDTVLQVEANTVLAIPDRDTLRMAQTPQGFHVGVIQRAHELFFDELSQRGDAVRVTDDCGLILRYGLAPIRVVQGDPGNTKITYPDDLDRAEDLLRTEP